MYVYDWVSTHLELRWPNVIIYELAVKKPILVVKEVEYSEGHDESLAI